MLDKELEILRLIEELYHGDTTEQDMLDFAEKNQVKVQAWRDAFVDYPLYEITKAINHFYVKKNSKSRPNIKQIMAILEENNAEKAIPTSVNEPVKPSIGIQYAMQDDAEGNMRWFVPDYIEVEKLIRKDKWLFVHNIYQPTLEEFHRCLELYCEEQNGKTIRFFSDNDIAEMSDEKREALRQRCQEVINEFKLRKLN